MVGDPNWLYSTIAQSSAAIVAIVGGFITATVLMLMAEKRSLVNQLSEKKARLKALEATYDVMTEGSRAWTKSDSNRKSDLEKEIRILKSEVTALDDRLKTFSYPQNLGWGVVVLGYLAVFGILFPILVIWKEAYSDLAKTLTTFLFYIGIIGIFAYIVFLIRALRMK